jgi:transcriptional regulator with XRE-family HTH domain
MARRDPETSPAAFFGAELRRARVAAGFSSQDALAARIGFDRSVIAKAETGERPPTPDVLAAWCEACGLDAEMFARMAVLARSNVPRWFAGWRDRERTATSLCWWEPLLVPGLVQTPDYARALFRAWRRAEGDDLEELVSMRTERQSILSGPEPASLWVIIDETVLHRCIGDEKIMYDQLRHLAVLATRPTITVQVVPTAVRAHVGLLGAFAIAAGDGADTVYMESPDEGHTTEVPGVVAKLTQTFNILRGEALSLETSRELIMKEAEERWI